MTQWKFDTKHTTAEFSAKHMMITTVRGSIPVLEGTLNLDPENPAAASVEATLDAAGIHSGVADRDNHLRSADFLDAAQYPTLHFKSAKVTLVGDKRARVEGDLTIRSVTKPVTLDVKFEGSAKAPFDQSERAAFSATTSINREDWGLTWNVALEAGGWLVSREVKLALEAQVVKVAEAVAV